MRLYSSAFLSLALLFFSLLQTSHQSIEMKGPDEPGVFKSIIKNESVTTTANKIKPEITVYTDFDCGPCRNYALGALSNLRKEYMDTEKIDLYIRTMSLSGSEWSLKTAKAAQCAANQNHFWEMHDALFADTNEEAKDRLEKLSKTIGLDENEFKKCMEDQAVQEEVLKEQKDALDQGIKELPYTKIDRYSLLGDQPYENIEWILRKFLIPN